MRSSSRELMSMGRGATGGSAEKSEKARRKEWNAEYEAKKKLREVKEKEAKRKKEEKEQKRKKQQLESHNRKGVANIQRAVRLLQAAYDMSDPFSLLIQKAMCVEFERAQRIASKGVSKFNSAKTRGEK